MIEFEAFRELIREIEAQGFDRETAGHYAALIGDTPIYSEDGKQLVVMEAGKVIATLKPLEFFKESPVQYSVGDFYGEGAPKPPDCIAQVSHLPKDQINRLMSEGRFDYKALERGQRIANAYEQRFGNFGEIALPEFLFEKRFEDLLEQAIKKDKALSQAEVAAVFPDAAWEY